MRRLGDTLYIWTHSGVKKQDHIQRLFLVAEVQDRLWLSLIRHSKAFPSEIRYRLSVFTNLSVHMNQRDIASERRLVLCKQEQQYQGRHVEDLRQSNGQFRSARLSCP